MEPKIWDYLMEPKIWDYLLFDLKHLKSVLNLTWHKHYQLVMAEGYEYGVLSED